MLGELGYVDGRIRRMRFALGCVGAALVLPPWGRAAAGVWALITLGVASLSLYAGLAIHYRLGGGAWIVAGILTLFVVGLLLGGGALVRRPGVAVPGLLGGLILALVSLTFSGFTLLDQVLPDIVHWHPWVALVVAPFVVGAAGTLRGRDPIVGRRIARLAAITTALGLYVYRTVAVAAIGGGGPFDEDGGGTLRGTISDRLANNMVDLFLTAMVVATVGWAGAAAASRLLRRTATPAGPDPLVSNPETQQEA